MAIEPMPPLSHGELYARVWAQPVRDVARDLHISDVGLAKTCRRLNVPLPGRGYWAKRAAGKSVAQTPLPEPSPGQDIEWRRDGVEPSRAPVLPPAVGGASSATPKAKLPSRHPLLAGVDVHFAKTRSSHAGYLRPTKRHLVDVFVTAKSLRRALDLANHVFLTLERRGHAVTLARGRRAGRPHVDVREHPGEAYVYGLDSWSPDLPTVVTIGTVLVGLSLYELSEQARVRYTGDGYVRVRPEAPATRRTASSTTDWTTMKDMPAGRLCLRAYAAYPDVVWQREWREQVAGDLVDQVEHIAAVIEGEAPTIVALIQERDRRLEEYRRRVAEEERQRREQAMAKQRQDAVNASVKDLQDLADAWDRRVRIEAFFADAVACAQEWSEAEQALIEARVQRARSLLNLQTPAERMLGWRTPEERLPEALRAGSAGVAADHDAEKGAVEQERPAPAPPRVMEAPKSYWQTRHWWQRR